jgi:hypothetical protein
MYALWDTEAIQRRSQTKFHYDKEANQMSVYLFICYLTIIRLLIYIFE